MDVRATVVVLPDGGFFMTDRGDKFVSDLLAAWRRLSPPGAGDITRATTTKMTRAEWCDECARLRILEQALRLPVGEAVGDA